MGEDLEGNIKNIRETVFRYLLLKKYQETAELIAKTFLNRNYIYSIRDDEKQEMWVYDAGVYIAQGKSYIKEWCREIMGEAYNTYVVNLVISRIEVDTYIEPNEFFIEQNFDEIPVLNGILNVRTREMTPYDPHKIFFNKLNIEYDVDKEIHTIYDFLYSILPVDEVEILQELFGYVLYKKYPFQKAFMLLGSGSNGKSVLLDLFKNFVSAENTSSLSLHQIQSLDSFSVSELFNKMVNLSGDISAKTLTNTALFKQIIGGERIGANRKFKNMVYFHNYAKFINSCNRLPKTYDLTDGFFRRWVILNFIEVFVLPHEYELLDDEEKKHTHLADPEILGKLIVPNEMSGLLNWALKGLERIFSQGGFSNSKTTKEIKGDWLRLSNSFEAFLMDCAKEERGAETPKSELSEAYKQYCDEHNLKLETPKVIANTLTNDHGCWDEHRILDGEKKRLWRGIMLKDREILVEDVI